MEQGKGPMVQCSNDVNKTEEQLRDLMKQLVESDPDGITRIERIFHKVRIERIVEKKFDA